MTAEKTIVKAIIAEIKRQGGYAIKTHGNAYSVRGTPDVLACLNGKMIAIECKNEKGVLSKLQEIELKKWNDAGALTGVARSLEDAKKIMGEGGTTP